MAQTGITTFRIPDIRCLPMCCWRKSPKERSPPDVTTFTALTTILLGIEPDIRSPDNTVRLNPLYMPTIKNPSDKAGFKIRTVCPRSSDSFYIVSYYVKCVTTFWSYNISLNWCECMKVCICPNMI